MCFCIDFRTLFKTLFLVVKSMVLTGNNLWTFQICFVRYHVYNANFIKFGMAVDLPSPAIDPVKPSLFGLGGGGEFFNLTVFRFEINLSNHYNTFVVLAPW